MAEKGKAPRFVSSGRRRRYRAARLRLHPGRDHLAGLDSGEGVPRRKGTGHVAQPPGVGAAAGLEQLKGQLLRTRADFDNYRKRMEKERGNTRKFALQDLLESLLPALDSFDQALQAAESDNGEEALAKGIRAIGKQMLSALADNGVEKIEAVGQPFDPNFHEALAVEKTDKHPDNTVIQVLQGGYTLNGRLVRPARVRIAQAP